MTIRWRLTLFYAVTTLLVVGLLLAVLFLVLNRSIIRSVDETTRGHAVEAAWLLQNGRAPDDPAVAALGGDGVYLIVRDGTGAIVATAGPQIQRYDRLGTAGENAIWPTALADGTPRGTDDNELERYGHDLEMYTYAVPVTGNPAAAVAEAWMSYDSQANVLIPALPILTFAIPLSVVIAIAGAWLMARQAMAPVAAIVGAARRISDQDLSRRLPVRHPTDELGWLARTFNEVLGRLDTAFRERQRALEEQRRFVSDASHELRTPLTSIRGYARMLREWAHDDPAATREAAAAIERESTRMQRLVESLLQLARGDEGMVTDETRAGADLRAIVADAVDDARIAAAGRVPILAEAPPGPVPVRVDRDAIQQVLAILLDNALRHSPSGPAGTITVRVAGPAGDHRIARVEVRDAGPGIPAEHFDRIFDRFFRGDAARTGPGAGLGLAIARQVVERHGGTIAARNGTPGAVFTITLPGEAPPGPVETDDKGDGPPVGQAATTGNAPVR